MLFGTGLLFRICYFFTSFAPALFIICLKQMTTTKIGWSDRNLTKVCIYGLVEYVPLILVVVIAVGSGFYLRYYLKKIQGDESQEVGNIVLNFETAKKRSNKVYVVQVQEGPKINSGFISFAMSVVAPSVLLNLMKGKQFLISILITFMFFLLLMMSNDVFPNIILPIFGIQLMVTKDGYNIFYFSKDESFLTGVKRVNRIGNTGSLARTYIVIDKEYNDSDLEVIDDV